MSNEKQRSPWFYVAIGCGGLVLLAVIAFVAMVWFGAKKVKELEAEMKDPAARAQKVRTVMGAETLPEGYHPMMAFSIPMIMDIAMLTDAPPDEEGRPQEFGKTGYIYVTIRAGEKDRNEMWDYVEGRKEDPAFLNQSGFRLDSREMIGRGSIDLHGRGASYVAHRGELEMEQQDKSMEGLLTMVLFDCPDDSRLRMGFWFAPDTPGDDLSGTPADAVALGSFLTHFRPCE